MKNFFTLLSAILIASSVMAVDLLEIDFTQGQGDWTIDNKELGGIDKVWQQTSAYGMKASAYVNATNYATESWLISPAVSLKNITAVELTFFHARRYGDLSQLSVKASANGESWITLNVSSWPNGSNWNYITAEASLSAFEGLDNVRIAFVYTSNSSNAATWEIKTVKISGNLVIDGIRYNLNSENHTAEVVSGNCDASITIPESVTCNNETYSVTSIGYRAFYNCSGLTSVTIPKSVTSIGWNAFYGCSGLTTIVWNAKNCKDFPSTPFRSAITSFTLGDEVEYVPAFLCDSLSNLTSITIPNSVTSIGDRAFRGCSSLTKVSITDLTAWCNINFSNINANPLYYAEHLFLNNVEITNFVIPNSVTSIGDYTFYNCSSLTSLTIGNSVTSIGDCAFAFCRGLTSVTIPNSVTNIGERAFYGCSGLTSVTIPESVTSIRDYTFDGCTNLSVVTIPSSVTSIGKCAFYGCSSLTSVTIPESVTSIGSKTFYGCSGLTTIVWNAKNCNDFAYKPFTSAITSFTLGEEVEHIPAYLCDSLSNLTSITIPNSVTSIGSSAFSGCSSLTKVSITDLTAWCNINFSNINANPLYYAKHLFLNNVEITNWVIPNSVTSIGDYTFYNCSSLTSLTIGNSVTSIGYSAFSGCSGLTSITIPNSVTFIGSSAFSGCSGLTSITIPNSVTSIGSYAFNNCSGLTSIDIPNSVTSIGHEAFYGCSGLTSVTIGNSVTSIGDRAFKGCSALTSIAWNAKNCADFTNDNTPFFLHWYNDEWNSYDLRSQITSFSFGKEVEHIPAYLCAGMNNLTSINIPYSVTSIGDQAFTDCNNITTVAWNAKNCNGYNFGNQVESFNFGDKVEFIPDSICSGMSLLTSVIIPNSVSSIGNSAFEGCSNIETLSLGNSMESIGDKAFSGCERIIDIYSYAERVPTVQTSTFDGVSRKAYLWVPANRVRNYKTHEIWGEFDVHAIEADGVNTSTVKIVPTDNTAKIIWPEVEDAETYEITIYDQNGNIVCTLVFDSAGLLQSIAFAAPNRDNGHEATQASGFRFEVTGLTAGTEYTYTIVAKDVAETIIDTQEGSFTTTGGTPTAMDNASVNFKPAKVIRNGQLFILREGKTYTLQGQEVR